MGVTIFKSLVQCILIFFEINDWNFEFIAYKSLFMIDHDIGHFFHRIGKVIDLGKASEKSEK